MLKSKTIVVVVPAYNVGNQIQRAIHGIQKYVDHIVIVNDCSKDNTREMINSIDDNRIIVVDNAKNKGVGGATVTGFKKGIELGGDIFVKYDGDGQMDPEKMTEIIMPLLDGYDYAKGNRFIHSKELTAKMPKARLLGNFILTFFTKLASGCWHVFDPQNGYFAITRESLESIDVNNLHNRYFFENDMLVNLSINGARIKDVRIPAKYGDEKSSLKIWKIILIFPWLLLHRFINRVYRRYILYDFSVIGIFYTIGSLLILWGTLFGAFAWAKSIITGIVTTTGTVMISVLPLILGFQLFLQAIVLEVQNVDNNKRN